MTTIKLKNGSGAPTAGDLAQGEPALDLTNKRLYTEDSGGTVIEVGTNPGTDVTFADDRKAIFGAGSDLQIYSDGTTGKLVGNIDVTGSVTADGGTIVSTGSDAFSSKAVGGYAIQAYQDATSSGHTALDLRSDATTGTRYLIRGYNDAAGTPTEVFSVGADGGAYLNGNVGIGTSSLSRPLHVNAAGTDGTQIQVQGTTDSAGIKFKPLSGDEYEVQANTSSDWFVYNRTDAAYRLLIDGDGNVGIGTSSPSTKLDILSDSNSSLVNIARFASNNNAVSIGIGYNEIRQLADANSLNFGVHSGTAMTILDGGNVGIGTGSPAVLLDIAEGTAATDAIIGLTAGTGGRAQIRSEAQADNTSSELSFYTMVSSATNERMRIDSNGNVGIGTDSPQGLLHVDGFDYSYFSGNVGSATLDNEQGLAIGWNKSSGGGETVLIANQGAGSTGGMVFATNTSAGAYNERMSIDSSGNLLVGRTSTSGLGKLNVDGGADFTGGDVYICRDSGNLLVGGTSYPDGTDTNWGVNQGGVQASSRNTTATAVHYTFFNSNGAVGSISTNGSATAYNTSSDQRLKDNIVDAPSASDDIDAIQVRSFDWKADGSHQKYGMVAQELQSVAPEAVSVGETEEDMMGVDYSKLVPMMMKEIQSLRARVAQLEGAN